MDICCLCNKSIADDKLCSLIIKDGKSEIVHNECGDKYIPNEADKFLTAIAKELIADKEDYRAE